MGRFKVNKLFYILALGVLVVLSFQFVLSDTLKVDVLDGAVVTEEDSKAEEGGEGVVEPVAEVTEEPVIISSDKQEVVADEVKADNEISGKEELKKEEDGNEDEKVAASEKVEVIEKNKSEGVVEGPKNKEDAKDVENTKDLKDTNDSELPDEDVPTEEENFQSALEKFNSANITVEYGNDASQIQYAELEGYENIVDTINSYYLSDEDTKIKEAKNNVFVSDYVEPVSEGAKTKESKTFNIVVVEKQSFVNSVDTLKLRFSSIPKVADIETTKFSITNQNKEEINPVAVLVKGKEIVLSFDAKERLNFSVLKIKDVKNENEKVLKGGFLPVLQNTDQIDYDLLVANLYGSYVAKITDEGIEIDDNISFGAMDEVRTSSTVGVSFNNQANVSESCSIFIYGTDLRNTVKNEDIFYIKNYTLLSRQRKINPLSEKSFNVFERYLAKDEMMIGYVRIKDLDKVKGLPTLYINLQKPKEVDPSSLYRGKLSFDLVCS